MSQVVSNTTLSRILLLLIVAAGALFFAGFLVPVLAALIICFASWPIFQHLKRWCGNRSTIAASVALLAILLGLVIPLGMVITYTIGEVRQWTSWLVQANEFGAP